MRASLVFPGFQTIMPTLSPAVPGLGNSTLAPLKTAGPRGARWDQEPQETLVGTRDAVDEEKFR